MSDALRTSVGRVTLKNPLIAGSAEHLIEAEGVRRALRAGVGAVVVKSTNESQAARHQLQCAEYMVLDDRWTPIPWNKDAPAHAFVACRSGLSPQSFDEWLAQTAMLDREAKDHDSYAVASLILAELDHAVAMARQVEEAGIRVLELNIGTPYASQAAKGAVSTELDPARIGTIVTAVRAAVTIPLWIKITGQSERVPELAAAAFAAGGEAVVMAGRSLGLIPDVETFAPMLGTTLGVGGPWNLPLTCQWLALSRGRLGVDKPLIGTNGAQSGLDVARMMLAGASAVEMSSPVMLRGFELLSDSLAELEAYLARKGVTAAELIGRAADSRKSFAQMPLRQDNWRNYVPR
ncbi:tRNA-dihydrouridine synthase [Rhodoplanes sp. TEM]|uniref:dihydrouracil dehydrogenase (NAD(+)) n=1 Tax=Rhodoplanes tepidamans TaxID=200616 RepID=A0ABT5JIH2_RHOTP|nr:MULTISPECIES: tRNA-dihydrouridine synthase [Rhodoplanes]MDC7789526.1 tRNA-dihydrouridine synthase [Rhodoplanes tepidamans]MDC7987722.1 tRNA-dihydrouridine synthase [Rhodoplanes sp. TEM]MDQ0354010.1 dihydroorotate dehydrogenase [Rhodoplanes tepidamans]